LGILAGKGERLDRNLYAARSESSGVPGRRGDIGIITGGSKKMFYSEKESPVSYVPAVLSM